MHRVKSAFVVVWDSVSQSNKSRARKEMLMSAAFIQQWQIQSEKLVANDKERERQENRQWKCNGALVKAVHEQNESKNTHGFCLVSDSLPLTSTQNTWHTGSLISRRASVWTSFLNVPPPLPATWENERKQQQPRKLKSFFPLPLLPLERAASQISLCSVPQWWVCLNGAVDWPTFAFIQFAVHN